MQSEQDWLDSELTEIEENLRQLRWMTRRGSHERIFHEWVRAKRNHSRGVDEALVTAHFTIDGQLVLERYALPCGRSDWIECDEAAFRGYGADGESGLVHGVHRSVNTRCNCEKKIHHSEIRAQAFSRMVAAEAGTLARQRDYACEWNPRAFHLSSKRDGRPIPGAYVVLPDGWKD